MNRKTKNHKLISASKEAIYNAFTQPKALETWLVPGDMKGKIHHFDLKVGGGYEMSLYYPEADGASQGKTGQKEDRYTAEFKVLQPFDKIIQTIVFKTSDEKFNGEMTMSVFLKNAASATEVTIEFENIPIGIALKDNEEGTGSSLEKLSKLVEGMPE